jgi:outer membrane protein assembly factor BamB
MTNITHAILMLIPILLTGCHGGMKESWPQWGGPDRNFVVSSRPLDLDWPESGPPLLWKRELGPGYGTIASDGQLLFTMYRDEADGERVLALDPRTGKTVWQYQYRCPLIDESAVEVPKGEGEEPKKHDTRFGTPPQSTPLVVKNRVYTFGFCGRLMCFDAVSGRVQWQHDLYNDFGANFNRFGYSTSPVAYKDTIILPVGGKNADGKHNGIMAFDQNTGAVRWRSTTFDTVWSSPILVNLDGEDLLISYMEGQLLSISPATGALRWQYQAQGKFDESIITPIWCPDNRLFCRLGGDETGATVMRFSRSDDGIKAERLWLTEKVQSSLANPVLIGDTFYGSGGRSGMFSAWDLNTGEILWRERGYPRATVIAAGPHLLILDEKGLLTLATPDREKINVKGTCQVLEEPSWTSPTLLGSTLLMRDNKHIVAYDLSPDPQINAD